MSTIKRRIDLPEYIDAHRKVCLKYLGNKREIVISEQHNTRATIKPISKNHYLLLSTGEVKTFETHAKDRTENIRNLEKTMRNLSDLINANISSDTAISGSIKLNICYVLLTARLFFTSERKNL